MSAASATKSPLTWAVHVSALLLVAIWLLPTFGLLVSSVRTKDQIAVSGWWTAMTSSTQNKIKRAPGADGQVERDGKYVISGNVLEGSGTIQAFGFSSRAPKKYQPGDVATLRDGSLLTVEANGDFEIVADEKITKSRGATDIHHRHHATEFHNR